MRALSAPVRRLALATAMGLVPAVAAADEIPVLAASGSLEERLTNAAEVSAPRIVVGVMLAAESTALEPTVSVVVPSAWHGTTVCARFLSSDALYEAYGEYDVPAALDARMARLEFATQHTDALVSLDDTELAVTISRGPCRDDSRDVALSLWRTASSAGDGDVLLLVNSQGASEVYLYVPTDEGGFDVPCRLPDAGPDVGFDHHCYLPLGDLPATDPVEIEVNRVRYGAFQDPERVDLWIR